MLDFRGVDKALYKKEIDIGLDIKVSLFEWFIKLTNFGYCLGLNAFMTIIQTPIIYPF